MFGQVSLDIILLFMLYAAGATVSATAFFAFMALGHKTASAPSGLSA